MEEERERGKAKGKKERGIKRWIGRGKEGRREGRWNGYECIYVTIFIAPYTMLTKSPVVSCGQA